MQGQHVYMRCLVGGLSKDTAIAPGFRTAAITPGIFTENDLSYFVEPKCVMDEGFANKKHMLNSKKSVLRIYHPAERCTVATRVSWIMDRITDGRSASYAFSHILTDEDHDHILNAPDALFDPSAYESYDSVCERVLKAPNVPLSLDNKYTLRQNVPELRVSHVLFRCGFDYKTFDLYLSGLIAAMAEKEGRLYVLPPDDVMQTWGEDIDLVERLILSTIKILPHSLKKNATVVSRWPFGDADMSMHGIHLIFTYADSEETLSQMRRSKASILDIRRKSATYAANSKLQDYTKFLWDNIDDQALLSAFSAYTFYLCGDILNRMTINPWLISDWFCMWKESRQAGFDRSVSKAGIISAIRVFASVADRLPNVEKFLFDALVKWCPHTDMIDTEMDEAIAYLTQKNKRPLSYYDTMIRFLLNNLQRGVSGKNTEQILFAEFHKFPQRMSSLIMELLRSCIQSANTMQSEPLLRLVMFLLRQNEVSISHDAAWILFCIWGERAFRTKEVGVLPDVLGFLRDLGAERRWSQAKSLPKGIRDGIFSSIGSNDEKIHLAARQIIQQDAKFFMPNPEQYITALTDYLEDEGGFPQYLLLPLYYHCCMYGGFIKYAVKYKYFIEKALSRTQNSTDGAQDFLVQQLILYHDFIQTFGFEKARSLFCLMEIANMRQLPNAVVSRQHIEAVLDLFGSTHDGKLDELLRQYMLHFDTEKLDGFMLLCVQKCWLPEALIQFVLCDYDRKHVDIWGNVIKAFEEIPEPERSLLFAVQKVATAAMSEQRLARILSIYCDRLAKRKTDNITEYIRRLDEEGEPLRMIIAPYPRLGDQINMMIAAQISEQLSILTDDHLTQLPCKHVTELYSVLRHSGSMANSRIYGTLETIYDVDRCIDNAACKTMDEVIRKHSTDGSRSIMHMRLLWHIQDSSYSQEIKRGLYMFAVLLSSYLTRFQPEEYLQLACAKKEPYLYYCDLIAHLRDYTVAYAEIVYRATEQALLLQIEKTPGLLKSAEINDIIYYLRPGTLRRKLMQNTDGEKRKERPPFGLKDILLCFCGWLGISIVSCGLCWLLLAIFIGNPLVALIMALCLLAIVLISGLMMLLSQPST